MTLEEKFLTILMLVGPPVYTPEYLVAYVKTRKHVGLGDGYLGHFDNWCKAGEHYQRELPPAD